MRKRSSKKILFIFITGLVLSWAVSAFSSEVTGVWEIIEHANSPIEYENLDPVLPLDKKIVKAKVLDRGKPFWVETRKENIERFNCSGCHSKSSMGKYKDVEPAHGGRTIDHGGNLALTSCFECHNKENRDYLKTEKIPKLEFNHAYMLCGQCHFRQKRDWIGGAHGRRVSFWVGQRIVKNCTFCHNPHSPLFKKRWPKTYSPPKPNLRKQYESWEQR